MGGKETYFNIVQDVVDLLTAEEKWAVNYATDVVLEQIYRTYTATHPDEAATLTRMDAIEKFKVEATRKDFLEVVSRIVTILSRYKREEDIRNLESRLRRIVNTYIKE